MDKNLYVIGSIDESTIQETLKTLLENDPDDDLTGENELTIYINSEGGYLFDCFAFIDLITLFKHQFNYKVNTIGLGEVASAGFFIFLLGDQRILTQNAKIFVHEHIVINETPAPYTEKLKEQHMEKDWNSMYTKYTAERLNIPISKARKLLKSNKWLTQKEVESYGIVTDKLEQPDSFKTVVAKTIEAAVTKDTKKKKEKNDKESTEHPRPTETK